MNQRDPINIPLQISGKSSVDYSGAPVTVGMPFAQGALQSTDALCVLQDSQTLPLQSTVTATWPDGSVRWLLLDFILETFADQSLEDTAFSLASETSTQIKQRTSLQITEDRRARTLTIDTGAAQFFLSCDRCFPIETMTDADGQSIPLHADLSMEGATGQALELRLDEYKISDQSGSIRARIQFFGHVIGGEATSGLNYDVAIEFYAGSSQVAVELGVHNENAAIHPGGVWDLGDPGSRYFKHFSLDLTPSDGETFDCIRWKNQLEQDWQHAERALDIYQESSGGSNWQSSVHKNQHGLVPLKHCGARCTADGADLAIEKRPSPIVSARANTHTASAVIREFWQNFPSAVSCDQRSLSLQVFPRNFPDLFELQGGEKKHHQLSIDFSGKPDTLHHTQYPAVVSASRGYYAQTQAIPFLSLKDNAQSAQLRRLIDQGIEGDNSFYAKRERIDEYGWRNYGELYADHEGAYHEGEQPLVSHYNNQYDPILGLFQQFFVSGRYEYFDLMDSLARHVVDIDIYHTDKDRAEYSNGLFWHTDHYLDAETCTHRTISKHHNPESYWDYQKGGGPGEEHCYSSGLLMHYFLTGNEHSKAALRKLGEWVPVFHRGSGTVLERIKSFASSDLKKLLALCKGLRLPRRSHPLSRATGNLLNAQLDLFQLTGEKKYIQACAKIIGDTIHPNDDIEARELLDIEKNWSYTVFFQALIRFLEFKRLYDDTDMDFEFARQTLETYGTWMLKNESPSLDQADSLEHPNGTWLAQDLRKVNVLFAAAFYAANNRDAMLEKGNTLFNHCLDALTASDEATYTRILTLMMQSYGVCDYFAGIQAIELIDNADLSKTVPAQPYYSISGILANFLTDTARALMHFSPRREYRWLKHRIG